ncbi:DUF998 domain-containing protein [Micromonospora endophytica]|uniref:DUF998 domain-containing protein n=1 Tax=Micromonospora endophytica TaxID=515350 RepID=A0A2W2DK00_9ACTN|nr:DUF998 domain-containing protein [Micromonospora endophytica]PZF97496.1 DUF998 domain-containing protein [Micromonospora endophytica]RIW45698.1 DUF998 domain-containing protein [Micromonospora endophytica]BCJ62798.1 hypothetical protein Jiend_62200 [Micromonospora endophytica]
MEPTPVPPSPDARTLRRLRLGVGGLGITLPIVLPVGHALATDRLHLLNSMSSYYHSEMRDVFVGSLCAIGVFLINYRYRRLDDVLSTTAGGLAVVVALVPTTTDAPPHALADGALPLGRVHGVAAGLLFAILALFCLWRFPVNGPPPPGTRARNVVYRTCGFVILAAIVLAVASSALAEPARDTFRPVFWCEAVAVFAFGVAWLVKGEAMFHQSPEPVGAPVPRAAPADRPAASTP